MRRLRTLQRGGRRIPLGRNFPRSAVIHTIVAVSFASLLLATSKQSCLRKLPAFTAVGNKRQSSAGIIHKA